MAALSPTATARVGEAAMPSSQSVVPRSMEVKLERSSLTRILPDSAPTRSWRAVLLVVVPK
jgi:hypothetical protein